MDDTIRRRQLVRDLVTRYQISSQDELVDLLRESGVPATQPTVSRDLEVLGIAKVRAADGLGVYITPEQPALAQALRQFALSVDASGNLAVIRTPPGSAGAIAAAIDAAVVPGVLATLQGDDTVLVVAVDGTSGADIAARLHAIKENRP
ncbi:MAG: arginine repressor [Egibacteraceae bacterium]